MFMLQDWYEHFFNDTPKKAALKGGQYKRFVSLRLARTRAQACTHRQQQTSRSDSALAGARLSFQFAPDGLFKGCSNSQQVLTGLQLCYDTLYPV